MRCILRVTHLDFFSVLARTYEYLVECDAGATHSSKWYARLVVERYIQS